MKASGSFAAHFASTSGRATPFSQGRSKYRGGLFGSGDHAAADASCGCVYQGRVAASAGDFRARTALSVAASIGFVLLDERQQGLMTYRLPKTSGCCIPMRMAP